MTDSKRVRVLPPTPGLDRGWIFFLTIDTPATRRQQLHLVLVQPVLPRVRRLRCHAQGRGLLTTYKNRLNPAQQLLCGGLSNVHGSTPSACANRSMLESDTFQRERSTADT